MTKFLASVRNLREAKLAYSAGADIIDLKNPAEGALGALPLEEITAIAGKLKHRTIVSATIGDLPVDPDYILPAVESLQQTAVDIIKIGFFPGNQHALANALAALSRKQKLVAVLFADQKPDIRLLKTLSNSHFYGVMLDTARKDDCGLLGHLTIDKLKDFIRNSHQFGLICGLAGQLKLEEIPVLLPLQPDYLGFRSALCQANRNGRLSLNEAHRAQYLIKQEYQLKTSSIQRTA